ncbi:MAG: TonB-dependent receptor [Terricaulis sp.]
MGKFQGRDRAGNHFFSRLAGAASVIALSAALPGLASAQTAEPEAVEPEIVVTGIRAGLASSIATKRDETSIVEVVTAEDIGKLPDVSIAESIARLPGLAAQRINGRAQIISLRGLAPDFTTTLLNGRQQASSGDNRGVEFDQYPSELLSSVVVYKTPDATISGFGLAGTADLRTVRPLEFGERAVAVNLRFEGTDAEQLNEDVDTNGNRFSISYVNQFFNDTLGVAFGYAHLDSPSQNLHYKAYGYEAFGFAVTPDSADSALQLNGQEVFAYSRENVRDAFMGIIEWAPSAQWHNTLDLYYSTFSQQETMRGAQWFSNGWADGATFTNVQTTTVGGSLFGQSGTFNRAVPQLRNDYNTRDDTLFSVGLNSEYQITDNTRIFADLAYSRNERDEQVLETYAGYGLGVGGVTNATQNVGRTFDVFTFDIPTEGYPTYTTGLNYADASQVSLGDRAPWGGWSHDGSIRFPHVEDTVTSGEIGMEFDLDTPVFNRIDVGLNWTSREKSKFVGDFDLFLNGVNRQQILVGSQYLVSPTSLDFAGLGNVLSVNLPAALDVYYRRAPILDENFYNKTWEVREDVWTAYVRASFDAGPWRGNVGIQIVQQEQESTGANIRREAGGGPLVPVTVTGGADYTDILPSLNIGYDLGDGHRLRFAAAYTVARPRMEDLRANLVPNLNNVGAPPNAPVPGDVLHLWTASGGNPELEPWRAAAFDLAYEWYLDRTSYFSVALFYKDLDNFIFTHRQPFDFTGVPIRSSFALPPGTTLSPIGSIAQPANGTGGSVHGFEISGAFDFGLLFEPLEGLGLIGSYSQTESDLNPVTCTNVKSFNVTLADCSTPPRDVRIQGLSGDVFSLTGYYERGGFQARASYRYRSPFKGEVEQLFAAGRGATEIMEDEQVDAQIGYTFQEGSPLDGFGVLLQVNNLTNSPYRTRLGLDTGGTHTADGGTLPETYEEYGRQILLGLNYRY